MQKKLNAAAILMCLVGALGLFQGVWGTVATESFTQEWAEMMGTTVNGSPVLTMAVRFYAVYHFIALALLAVILILGAIGLGFGIAYWAPYAPFMYGFFTIWMAALALSAKPCLQKPG